MEKKNTIFENRLINYSLIAGAVLTVAPNIDAQIIYTNPADQSGTSQIFNINFDGAGEPEIVIEFGPAHGIASDDIWVTGGSSNAFMIASEDLNGSSNWYGKALALSVTIGPATTGGAATGFATNNNAAVLAYCGVGLWNDVENKYLGVKFKIGANTHYGWIRMTVLGSTNFNSTLFDFAYESTPNLGIKAGSQISLPVELTTFKAIQYENAVKLLWETATEVNNYGFNVERKLTDSELSDWETLGFIEGHGNSNSPKSYEFIDETAPADALEYRLKQIDTDGKFEYYSLTAKVNNAVTEVEENNLPLEFAIKQNYPNPFNPTTAINYQLSENSKVELKVFNLLGQEVATLVNREQAAGNYTVNFEASGLPSGVYVYKIIAGHFIENRKMMLTK